MTDVVIVGASLAGLRCAQALRAEGHNGSITVVGAERHLPYDRPPLSKGVLTGEMDASDVRLVAGAIEDIDLKLGCAAAGLDLEGQQVHLADGSTIPFDVVVIATGSRARKLSGSGLRNVLTLRTIDDAVCLRDAALRASRIVIVGGGFIGLEVAAGCRTLGLDVVVVEAACSPLARVLPAEVGQRVALLAIAGGVDLRLGSAVAGIEGNGAAERVLLENGEFLSADLVFVGVGARPNVEWLEGSGLSLDDGVVCDHRCAAADCAFAAGDVARWWHLGLGQHLRLEHWTNAVEQARAVAQTVVRGDDVEPYCPVPFVWSDQFGAKVQQCGLSDSAAEVETVEDDPVGGHYFAVWHKGGEAVGGLAINRPAKAIGLRRALGERWGAYDTA